MMKKEMTYGYERYLGNREKNMKNKNVIIFRGV